MKTLLVDGVRYKVETQKEGPPKLVPVTDAIVDGCLVKAGNETYTLITTFTDRDMRQAIVRATTHRARSPYRVVPFDDLRPAS